MSIWGLETIKVTMRCVNRIHPSLLSERMQKLEEMVKHVPDDVVGKQGEVAGLQVQKPSPVSPVLSGKGGTVVKTESKPGIGGRDKNVVDEDNLLCKK